MPDVVGRGTIVLDGDTTAADQALAASSTAANKTAKSMSDSYTAEFNKITSVGAFAARQVGGEFGKLGTDVNRIVKPLTMVSAELGAIGAAAVGVGAVGYAMASLARSADEADKQLEKLGIRVDSGAQANIEAYRKAQQNLTVQIDETKVAVGSGFAEAFAILDQAFATDLGWVTKYAEKIASTKVDVILLHTALDGLAKAVGIDPKAAQAEAEYTAMLEYQGTVVLPKNAEELRQLIEAQNKSVQGDKEADQILASLNQQRATATEQLKTLTASMNRELLDPQGQIIADLTDRYDKIGQIASKTGETAQVSAAYTEASLVAENRLTHAQDERIAAIEKEEKAWADLIWKFKHDSADLQAEVKKDTDTLTLEIKTGAGAIDLYLQGVAGQEDQLTAQILGNIATVEQGYVTSLQNRINAGQQLTDAQIRQGNEAIVAQKALSEVQAGISATLAGLATYTALVMEFVPPPVAAGFGVAVTASSFAAAVAGIESGSPAFFSYPSSEGSGDVRQNGQGQPGFDSTTGQGIVKTTPNVQGDDSGPVSSPKGGQGAQNRSRNGPDYVVGIDPATSRLVIRTNRPGKRDRRSHR
jgi:microcompartment protein CcmL/EutN